MGGKSTVDKVMSSTFRPVTQRLLEKVQGCCQGAPPDLGAQRRQSPYKAQADSLAATTLT